MTDIATVGDIPSDPLDLALYATLTLRAQVAGLGKQFTELNERVAAVEGDRAIAAETRDWPSLRGFILRYRVRPMDDMSDQGLAYLGQRIAAWHRNRDLTYRRKAAYHDVHGSVNRYDSENLHQYFTEAGYTLDEDTYQADRNAGL